MGRGAFTHSILHPACFMQNFSKTFLKPVDGVITVPTGDGAEAFVGAEDIAAVAAATLARPGAQYAPTGPEALTVSDAADVIADVTGQPAKHNDIDRNAWIDGSVRGRRARRVRPDAPHADRDHRLRPWLPA